MPTHLKPPLKYWLQGQFGYRDSAGMRTGVMLNVANAARLPLPPEPSRGAELQDTILDYCDQNDEYFLDVLDATLHVNRGNGAADLRHSLEIGGSAWTTAPDGKSLHRRVDPEAHSAASEVMGSGNGAAQEIQQAWAAAFGRTPNPSDAWDHAIKAVEAVLIPVVVPAQHQPQFGHVLGQLKNQGQKWKLALPGPGSDHGVERLVSMLELLWPNPDRHANHGSRPPTLQEAQMAVHLAVTIVQWVHVGGLAKR